MSWKPTEEKKIGFAVYNYDGDGPHKLSLRFGDVVTVMEECGGWYKGCLYYSPAQKGIFPISCVHLKESMVVHRGSEDEVILKADPHCIEAGESLREWREHWHKLYIEHSPLFLTVRELIGDVIDIRTNLMSGAIASDNLQNLKAKLTTLIDVINDKLGLPMTPRKESGEVMDSDKCSTLDVFDSHQAISQDVKSFMNDSRRSWARRSSTLALQERGESTTSHAHHLYLSIDSINHTFPEDCELYFSLYDKEGKQYLTERCCIQVSKSTEGSRFDASHKPKAALFIDLGNRDLFLKAPYLVCHVVRNGRMLFADRKYNSAHTFRRPYACGVLDPSSVLKPFAQNEDEEERAAEEFVMPLSIIAKDNNMDFFTFQDNAIKRLASKGATLSDKGGFTLHVTLQLFKGDLSQVKNNSPKLNYATPVPRLGFPEIILPGDVRNDIYLILDRAEFDKGAKSAERNVEIAVTVCDDRGNEVKNAICTAAGFDPVTEYRSFIFYHNNTPRWGEVIKLNLPFEMLSKVHVKLGFRHLAKTENKDKAEKTFSFAFLKIMNPDGSIIQDGQYELCVYKAEPKKWKNVSQYLSLPSKKAESLQLAHQTASASNITAASGQIQRSYKEGIWMSTICCSTKLTQRIELLALLKWRQDQGALKMTLDRVAQVPGSEMFKFLQDTLDCLFQILTEHTDRYRAEVFNALIHILGFLQQGRFQHFKPVMDLYVRRHFSAALAYGSLMATLNERVKAWQDEGTGERLKGVFEVLEHLFHFIARSFALHCHGRTAGDDTLKVSLNFFFNGLVPIMRAPADERDRKGRQIVEMQSAILKNITAILPDLSTVMSEGEIASHMANVLNAVPLSQQPGAYQHKPTLAQVGSGAAALHQSALAHHKLTFIMNIIESPIKILKISDARAMLLPSLVCHLEDFIQIRVPVLGYTSDTTVLCVKTVGRMLAILQFGEERCSQEVIRHVLKLLRPMLALSFAITRGLPAAVGNWVNLLSLFHLCPIEDFQSFCDEQVHLAEFIGELISVFQRAVREPFFPDEWIVMHLVQNKIFLKIVRCCSEIMRNQMMNPKTYQHDLFQQSFELCVDVITQKCLQMEKTSLVKKKRLRQKFGDLRLEMAFVLMGLWGVLGDEHKEQFIISSMNDLLKMSLVRMPELRRITLPIIWDVMQVDRATLGTIKRVEAEVLDKLDNLLQAGWGDDEYKEAFADIILPHCHKQKDADFSRQGVELVTHVTRLIELVIDFRNVPDDDYNKDNRMGCMFNLLHFYHEIDKEELYIRYVYKLSALHRKDERYTEAALTLLLHGDTLKWDASTVVAPEGKYPRHSALARKEQLYKEAIQLLDLGKSWEVGIRLCKELATHYEMETFDYHKLGAILDTQAQFFRKIISELRVEPEYFRVGYFGRGFPHFLRNKEFVHRGLPYEQLGSFRKRLNYEFPNAEFLTFTTAPDESIKNSPGQHLQVFKVNPVPEEREVFRGREVDEKILNYYNTNDLCRFKYDRPFHRGERDKSCEFATLWIERTTMETSSRLPGVLSYYPVARADAVEIGPLELAIETVENKNREIATLTTACLENVAFHLQSLTMILSGVIDAAVNGGIDNYRKIFFTPAYLEASPEQEGKVKHLQKLIEEQCNILRKALDAHRKRLSADVEPLHNHMEGTYTKMRRIIFPHEAPKEPPVKSQPAFPRANTMKNRELPPLPVHIQEPVKQKTATTRPPRRVPSSRFGRGTVIQQSGPEGKQRPPPPTFAAPPPPASPVLPGRDGPSTEPYEVVDIDERKRSLTIAGHGTIDEVMSKLQVREETIQELDDYEPVDFDPEEIRRSVHENGHQMLLVPKSQGDSASVSSGSSAQPNSGRATPSVESVYSFDNLGGSSPPQAQGRPVESMYATELDKGMIKKLAGSARDAAQTANDSQENLYGFDRLNEPAQASATTTQQENVYGFDKLDQQRETAYGGFDHLGQTPGQDNTYGFDHLTTDGPQGGGANTEDSVYAFDTLDHASTTNKQGSPPTLPPRPKTSASEPPSKPTPSTPPQQLEAPPKVPEKKRKTIRKMNAISESSGDGVPLTPTTPSAANGTGVPPSYSGVTLRDANKPPVPRPRSQTENVLLRAESLPVPQLSTPSTAPSLPAPSTPPIPRPRQGSASKGSALVTTASPSTSTADTPPALPPKPSQSPPKQPSVPVRQLSTKSSGSEPIFSPSPLTTAPSTEVGPGTPPPLPHKPKRSPEPTPRPPEKGPAQANKMSALRAKFEKK